MELLELLKKRRSIRKYTEEGIPGDKLEKILQAGLLAPSSKAIYPVEFVFVSDRAILNELSQCKVGSAGMLKRAAAAVAVVGDMARSDAWIEDCSIAMTLMQLEAEEQGIGSCWVQCRGRETPSGESSEVFVRRLLNIPDNFGILAMLSLGMPAECPVARPLPEVCGSSKVKHI